MDSLEHALDIAIQMRESLQAELAEAREQRVLVRTLDVQGLFERARRRGELNERLAAMQQSLAEALAVVASELGIEKASSRTLEAVGTLAAKQLADGLSELRASAQALQEIDTLNQLVARRALACVRGYLQAVAPRGDVYDKSGAVRSGSVVSTARQVA